VAIKQIKKQVAEKVEKFLTFSTRRLKFFVERAFKLIFNPKTH